MPRRHEAVHSESKRLYLYAGNSVSDEIIHKLGIIYAVESPTIARLKSSPKSETKIKKPNPGQRYTRMRLLAKLVRILADRDALQVEAAKFYLKHIDFFSEEIDKKDRLGLSVDPETYALCQSLPYTIVAAGSISLLYRVIMYFFAVKNEIIDPPPGSKRVGIIDPVRMHKPVAPMPLDARHDDSIERVDQQVSVSIDPEGVWELDRLVANFKMKKMSLFRAFIKSVASDSKQLEGVKKFYRQEFLRKEPMQGRTIIRFNVSKQDLALLDYFSYKVTGVNNRSQTARSIIGYFYRSGDTQLD